jgi:hypothetical protein
MLLLMTSVGDSGICLSRISDGSEVFTWQEAHEQINPPHQAFPTFSMFARRSSRRKIAAPQNRCKLSILLLGLCGEDVCGTSAQRGCDGQGQALGCHEHDWEHGQETLKRT